MKTARIIPAHASQQRADRGGSKFGARRMLKCLSRQQSSSSAVAAPVVVKAAASGFVMVDQYLGMVSASWDASELTASTAICRAGAHQPGPDPGSYSEFAAPRLANP